MNNNSNNNNKNKKNGRKKTRRVNGELASPSNVARVTPLYGLSSNNYPGGQMIKFYDYIVAPSNVTTTGSVSSCYTIAQGTAQGQRIADKVWIKGMELSLTCTTANSDIFNRVRCIIFRWKMNSGYYSPSIASILQTPGVSGVESPYYFEGSSDYRVIYDRLYNLSGTASAPTIFSQVTDRRKMKIPTECTAYNANVLTGTGVFYILLLSDSAISPYPVVSFSLRTYYVDS